MHVANAELTLGENHTPAIRLRAISLVVYFELKVLSILHIQTFESCHRISKLFLIKLMVDLGLLQLQQSIP